MKLAKDTGDNGEQLSRKTIYIYHTPDVKVGSTYNVQRRVMEQGYDLEDVEILYRILPNCMSFNAIWRTEQLEARLRGYPDEHDGNRIAVNRVRATGGINKRRSYVLTNMETGEEILVQDASDFEAKAGITPAIISRTANPKQVRQKFVTIDGVRYTADYAE